MLTFVDMLFANAGMLGSGDLRLLSVHVVVRHGDRSPLHSVPNVVNKPFHCHLPSPSQLDTNASFTAAFLRKMEEFGHVCSSGSFAGYSLYPAKDDCGLGELTPLGVEQHILNGAFLREAYITKHKLIDTDDDSSAQQVRSESVCCILCVPLQSYSYVK